MSTQAFPSRLTPSMAKIAGGLPPSIAASVGRSIVRHSTVVWGQTLVLCLLLDLDKKRGRIILKIGKPSTFIATVKDLLAASDLTYTLKPHALLKALEGADDARNTLAHSLFVKFEGKIYIQVVRGTWEKPPPQLGKLKRSVMPEGVLVTKTLLVGYRRKIDAAIREVNKLYREITAARKALNEVRKQGILSDRRILNHSL